MAQKSKDQLIHCANCGEDYSTTYKKCPFCGARNSVKAPVPPVQREQDNPSNQYDQNPSAARDPGTGAPPPSAAAEDDDDYINDGYVFDGQDVFDDEGGGGGDASMNKGGKRLVTGGNGSGKKRGGFPEGVNWSRLITFLCSLVIIVAALVIVFTYVYPKLHGDPDSSKTPSSSAPTGSPSGSEAPSSPAPSTAAPQPTPDTSVDPPKSFTLESTVFTLNNYGDTATLKPVLDPADWAGTIIWSSSDPDKCSVSADGVVTNMNVDQGTTHKIVITGLAGTLKVECTVFVRCKDAVEPPVTTDDPNASPDPSSSDAPVASTNPGSLTTGTVAHVVNASSGLNVRGDPSTNNAPIASLMNGNEVVIMEDAGTDAAGIHWLKITFKGIDGTDTVGYVSAEFISAD